MPAPLFSRLRLAINAIPITASGKAASAQVIAPMPNADRAMPPTDALIALPRLKTAMLTLEVRVSQRHRRRCEVHVCSSIPNSRAVAAWELRTPHAG